MCENTYTYSTTSACRLLSLHRLVRCLFTVVDCVFSCLIMSPSLGTGLQVVVWLSGNDLSVDYYTSLWDPHSPRREGRKVYGYRMYSRNVM